MTPISKRNQKPAGNKFFWRNVWIKFRYSHWLRLFFDALSKIGLRITPFYVVREGLFGKTIPKFETGYDEYELGFYGVDDMAGISRIAGRVAPLEKLLERLELGQLCYGVSYKGRPVAFNWFNFEELIFDQYHLPMKAGEVCLFDAYTDMEFRGKALAPYVRYQSYKQLALMDKTRLYSISDYFNTSSIKFKLKLNARLIELYLLVILFKRWRFRFLLKKIPEPENAA